MLERFALFQGMPAPLLDHVIRHASESLLQEGEALFFKNDPSDFLALVLEGQIHEILYGPEGQELIVAARQAGETIDEMALLDRQVRSFTAIACVTTRILRLSRCHFPVLTSVPAVLERANSLLCLRMRQTIDSLESICLHRLESRLARYLLLQISGQYHDAAHGAEIVLPATQSILAAMLNVSRSKLNMQLQAWQRSGLATRKGNRLHIHHIDQLRRKAYLRSETGVQASRKAAGSPGGFAKALPASTNAPMPGYVIGR